LVRVTPVATAHPQPKRVSARRVLLSGAMCAWALLCFVVGTSLMLGHWYTLPTPDSAGVRLGSAFATLRSPGSERPWLAAHVLYSQCACSRRVLEHLFQTARPDDVDEALLLVGADPDIEERAAQAGFRTTVISPAELKARYFVEAAPLLLVLGADDSVRYAGGYTDRKQAAAVHDLDVFAGLRAGQTTHALPLYGCGVSKELQATLDPLGIKYNYQ
jgi:hypothetical protein